MKPSMLATLIFLVLVALLHVLRLALQTEVTANAMLIPFWVSIVGLLLPSGLALWLWREHSRNKKSPYAPPSN